MGIDDELPIKVQVNNDGAIWWANNRTKTETTEHVMARYIGQCIEDGSVMIVFVKSMKMMQIYSPNFYLVNLSKITVQKSFGLYNKMNEN